MELHEFSAKELARAKRRLNQKYFPINFVRANEQPVGVLLGDQPASGKTGLFEYVKQANSAHRFIEINGDEYRQYHPRAQEIDEEYGQDAPKYTIAVHDKAYCQIPLNLAKADADKLFDRLVVYTRDQTGQLIAGIDRLSDAADPLDFSTTFDQLRQPIFDDSFYGQQWLALKALAQQRGETDAVYLKSIDEFVGHFRQ